MTVSKRRQRRVSELIHRELSQILMLEMRDPRVAGVTVTGVDVTPDLLQARVCFTVLGDAEEGKEALTGLEHAAGFLRTRLAGRVRLRFVPQLNFELDGSVTYGRRIDELLDQIKKGSQSHNG